MRHSQNGEWNKARTVNDIAKYIFLALLSTPDDDQVPLEIVIATKPCF